MRGKRRCGRHACVAPGKVGKTVSKPKGLKRPSPASTEKRADKDWVVLHEFTPPGGIVLERGSIFRIRKWRGRWRFLRHVYNPANNSEWIDCVPYERSKNPRVGMRSIDPTRIVPEKPRQRRRKRKIARDY